MLLARSHESSIPVPDRGQQRTPMNVAIGASPPHPKPIPEHPLIDWDCEEEAEGYRHVQELVKTGVLPKEIADELPWQRCRCSHLRGAHRPGCQAHRCSCEGFKQDPRYRLESPP